MTSDQGSDTAVREREITAASFDDANEDALAVTLSDIAFVTTTLTLATLKSEPPDFDPWFHAVALLNRARETLVSSVHLARHRAPVDAFALLRVAVETAAVAVHITRDPVSFESYVGRSRKKYAATQAITPVRSLIPRLPEVWGSLSQAAIHANVSAFGPSRDADGHRVVDLFSRKADPLQDRQSLRGVSLAAALVFRAAELALFDESSNKPGWLKLHGSAMHATATAEKLVERRYQDFASGEQEAAQQADATDGPLGRH
jgi:hypothetical protein